ncbi:MAG: division/cell wall cluster transcriptional repressor MraZ [Pontibacterium sp.]
MDTAFRGYSEVSVDSKGRLAVPTRYRDVLDRVCAGRLVLTLDPFSPCLLLYPEPHWLEVQASVEALPNLSGHTRMIQRKLIGSACDIELDSGGRLLLPSSLRAKQAIAKKVVIIGQGSKFEIWSQEAWLAEEEKFEQEMAALDMNNLPPELANLTL